MSHLTEEETLQQYVAKLGDEFGRCYYYAFAEWVDLRLTWKQFQNLFCKHQERVDLMNRCGAAFFARVDKLFFESVLLSVCRLSDEPRMGKKTNLTVKQFSEFMDQEHKKKLYELLAIVETATEFARDWRNRHISHNDYELKFERAEPLQAITMSLVDGAVEALFNVFEYVEIEFLHKRLDNKVIDHLNNEMIMLDRLYLGDVEWQKYLQSYISHEHTPRCRPPWLAEE